MGNSLVNEMKSAGKAIFEIGGQNRSTKSAEQEQNLFPFVRCRFLLLLFCVFTTRSP